MYKEGISVLSVIHKLNVVSLSGHVLIVLSLTIEGGSNVL